MRQYHLRKDMDEYLSHKMKPKKKKFSIKDYFVRKEYKEKHVTVNDEQIQALSDSESSIVVLKKEPNFFKVLHDKIMSLFKK